MTLLEAKMTVKCPKTGTEITVRSECAKCPEFRHVSFLGLTPLVSCKIEVEKPITEVKPKEEKTVLGLKTWG